MDFAKLLRRALLSYRDVNTKQKERDSNKRQLKRRA